MLGFAVRRLLYAPSPEWIFPVVVAVAVNLFEEIAIDPEPGVVQANATVVDKTTKSTTATTMNGLALQDSLEARGIYTRLQTAIEMREIAEPYIKRKAHKHLGKNRVVIFSCGTGNPYFTTDTAAALRAAETEAQIILLGKAIDGVYSADPKLDPTATKFDKISYLDVLNKDLKVMDSTATALCKDNNIPILVFGIAQPENMVKAVLGENVGTLVE